MFLQIHTRSCDLNLTKSVIENTMHSVGKDNTYMYMLTSNYRRMWLKNVMGILYGIRY